MKKVIYIIIAIIIILATVYFIADIIYSKKIKNQLKSLKNSGLPTTITEIKTQPTEDELEAVELLTTAYQQMKKLESDTTSLFTQELVIADSINYFKNPQLFDKLVNDNKQLIDLILKASKYESADFQFKYEDGFYAMIPQPLVYINKFCQLLRVYVKKLAAEGKTEQACNALNQIIRLAKIAKDNTVLFHLIKMRSLSGCFDLIQLISNKADISTLENLTASLEQIDPRTSLSQAIQNELVLDVNFFINSKNIAHDVLVNMEKKTIGKRIFVLLFYLAPFRKYEASMEIKTMAQSIAFVMLPYYQSEANLIKLEKEFAKHTNVFTLKLTLFKIRTENLETRRNINWLGLKTLMFKQRYNKLPDELSELAQNIPLDPYNGKNYIYKKLPDGFMIYGVGVDKTDDGGNPERDIVWQIKL